jgi:diguanylate cyclase (GGDEF)-like protein
MSATMMHIDIPTLMVAGSFVAAISGLFLFFAWLQNREARGALWWAAGNLVLATGVPMLAAPGATLGVPSVVLAILLLNTSPALIWAAARSCNNHRPNGLVIVAGAVVWACAFAIPGIRLSASAQIGLNLAVMAVYLYAAAHEFWSGRRERLQARWPLIVLLILHGLFLTVGAVEAVIGDLPLDGQPTLGSWLGLIQFETLIFVVGTAIFAVAIAHERGALRHKTAAAIDSLTGVSTRRAFMETAETMLHESLQRDTALSLVIFDLDNFKSINDTYGHAVGDQALREFGAATRNVLRVTDVIGRLGGEEFAVVLPGSSVGAAYVVAERIRIAYAEACRSLDGRVINTSASAGVTTAHPRSTLDSLIAAADHALYRAKAEGRNRVEMADHRPAATEPAREAAVAGTAAMGRAA